MTGFGQALFAVDGAAFAVEVRSVNHRFLDLRIRLPRALAACESEVRTRIQQCFSRGKVDLVVSAQVGATSGTRFEIDFAIAEQYVRAAGQLADQHGLEDRLGVAALLGLPGVSRFVEPELKVDTLRAPLLSAVDEAIEAIDGMRRSEGTALERELVSRLARAKELASELASRAGDVREAVCDRLRKRAAQLQRETGLVDEARLHQEVVIAADRLDITAPGSGDRRGPSGHHRRGGEASKPRRPVSRRGGGERTGKTGGPAPRVPAAGAGARGQHDRVEGERRRDLPARDRPQDRAGAIAGTGPER
jgi:uncharacterized protein (TIGR00255 family)